VLVVVTGGSGGIGQAVCRHLRRAGHTAIALDRVPPGDAGQPYLPADAARRGEIAAAVHAAVLRFGPLHAVVNCLGVYAAATLDGFAWAWFDHSVQVNLAAPIEAALALRDCKARGRAVVVNIGSAGARTPSRDLSYAATKAAIEGATRSLARSLAQHGVMVFCVAPGVVDTPMSRAMEQGRRAGHVRRSTIKRAGTPDEVADLVCYLVSGATDLMTGSIINASGGLLSD
jgi:NAD(P)-dependent dehydrogenase (short-subunit alcohol dehydrogenase family)